MHTNSNVQPIQRHKDPFAKIHHKDQRREQRKAAIARKTIFLVLI